MTNCRHIKTIIVERFHRKPHSGRFPHSTKLPIASLRSAPPGVRCQNQGIYGFQILRPQIRLYWVLLNAPTQKTVPLPLAQPLFPSGQTSSGRSATRWQISVIRGKSTPEFGESVSYSLSQYLLELEFAGKRKPYYLKSKGVWIYCKILLWTCMPLLWMCWNGVRSSWQIMAKHGQVGQMVSQILEQTCPSNFKRFTSGVISAAIYSDILWVSFRYAYENSTPENWMVDAVVYTDILQISTRFYKTFALIGKSCKIYGPYAHIDTNFPSTAHPRMPRDWRARALPAGAGMLGCLGLELYDLWRICHSSHWYFWRISTIIWYLELWCGLGMGPDVAANTASSRPKAGPMGRSLQQSHSGGTFLCICSFNGSLCKSRCDRILSSEVPFSDPQVKSCWIAFALKYCIPWWGVNRIRVFLIVNIP